MCAFHNSGLVDPEVQLSRWRFAYEPSSISEVLMIPEEVQVINEQVINELSC